MTFPENQFPVSKSLLYLTDQRCYRSLSQPFRHHHKDHWATTNSSRTLLQPIISHECWQARKASQLKALWFAQAPSCGTAFQRLAYLRAERMHSSLFSPVNYRGPEMRQKTEVTLRELLPTRKPSSKATLTHFCSHTRT